MSEQTPPSCILKPQSIKVNIETTEGLKSFKVVEMSALACEEFLESLEAIEAEKFIDEAAKTSKIKEQFLERSRKISTLAGSLIGVNEEFSLKNIPESIGLQVIILQLQMNGFQDFTKKVLDHLALPA